MDSQLMNKRKAKSTTVTVNGIWCSWVCDFPGVPPAGLEAWIVERPSNEAENDELPHFEDHDVTAS